MHIHLQLFHYTIKERCGILKISKNFENLIVHTDDITKYDMGGFEDEKQKAAVEMG